MRTDIVLRKMLAYTTKVVNYCDKYTYDRFVADSVMVEACVFNLSQLGELCRLVYDGYAQSHPQIPWREMYGLRNRIVHDYEGVNLQLVWQIIKEDLPDLQKELQLLIGQ